MELIKDWNDIIQCTADYIEQYNNELPHLGLEKDENGIPSTPKDIYFKPEYQISEPESVFVKIDTKGMINLNQFGIKQNYLKISEFEECTENENIGERDEIGVTDAKAGDITNIDVLRTQELN